MNKEAIRLLDRLYKDLYLSEDVLHHSSGNKYDKFNNIKEYIDKLEDIHTRVSESKRNINYLKKLYYDKYVIKSEDIPETYYEHQKEILLERGYGHIEMTKYLRKQIQEEVINNQKERLDVWIDYFLSDDAKLYPFWAKYWAFQGMLKLGTYDKEKGEFHKRTKNTVEPFADLNREALAMSIDTIVKMLNKEEIDDKELEILVKTGSFQKIYSYILTKVLRDNKNRTKRNIGKWIKYDKGSNHMPLVESLKGYNTGWCTAGESTAKAQLQGGDFYVYYTLDENDEYKVPRIAIRMEDNEIGEIRGIEVDQNIESEMEEVVEEKLKEFPDKEEYYKKVNDMKKLTCIYQKHKNNEELTREELKFIYEIEERIKGFGYVDDSRIIEILYERDAFEDVSKILGNKEIYDGNLNLDSVTWPEGLVLPKVVNGDLIFDGLINLPSSVLPPIVNGHLEIWVDEIENLVLPQYVAGDIDVYVFTEMKKLTLPKEMGGMLYIDGFELDNLNILSIPENSIYKICIQSNIITPENIHLYMNNKTK